MMLAKLVKEMDYDALVEEFIEKMQLLRVATQKGHIPENIQGEAFVLYFLKDSCGNVFPSDISNAIGVSSARVATALNSLEDKGLITRRIDSEDRRKIIVELTPKGRERIQEQKKELIAKQKSVLMQLGEEDSKELVRIIGRLVDVLSESSDLCNR